MTAVSNNTSSQLLIASFNEARAVSSVRGPVNLLRFGVALQRPNEDYRLCVVVVSYSSHTEKDCKYAVKGTSSREDRDRAGSSRL